jgi:hypothetical protein
MRVEISTWSSFKPGDVVVENPAVPGGAIVVERPVAPWHPLVPAIVDIMCAWDPENGNQVPGSHTHSHEPAAEQCYWAYLVGPKVAELFAQQPDYQAGVDAYARHIRRIREAVMVATMSNGMRATLLDVIDAAPVAP